MDRFLQYSGAIPLNTDGMNINKNAYLSLSKLAGALLGTSNILVNNATCVPTAPASMQVSCGACEIYSVQNVDNTDYVDIAADITHQILKQGINLDATLLTLTAPGTGGQSINYLIQYGFLEQDAVPVILNYYNASNPSSPFNGPDDTGVPDNTFRLNEVVIQAKQGAPALTGSQVTPTPDPGFIGVFVVTIANGQTTITSSSITAYIASNPNLITETLIQKISQVTADARYSQISQVQNGQFVYANDIGTANAYACTLSPAITAYVAGLGIRLKIANANSGASTLSINGLPAKAITLTNGNALTNGEMVAGMIAALIYDGTKFQLIDPISSGSITSQVQSHSFNYFSDVSVSANTIRSAINAISPTIVTPSAGLFFYVKIANSNTGASTLIIQQSPSANVTFTIKNINGTALSTGQLLSGMIAEFLYDGTNLQLLNPAVSSTSSVTPYHLQQNTYLFAVATGTLNNYIVSLPNTGVGISAEGIISFVTPSSNTGPCTVTVLAFSNASIVNMDGSALRAYQILQNNVVNIQYSPAWNAFVLLNPMEPQMSLYKPLYFVDNGSIGNAFEAMAVPNMIFIAWLVGVPIYYLVPHNNTAAATFEWTASTPNPGILNLKKPNGSALISGSMVAGMIAHLMYDGTNMQLLNPQA